MDNERTQYWQNEDSAAYEYSPRYATFEFRAIVALDLIRHFGSVAGIYMDREDSAKRAVMELQTPGALVTRCFAIADAFVNKAENRGEIRKLPEKEKPAVKSLRQAEKDAINKDATKEDQTA